MNAQHVWLAQATEAPRISLEYIRHQATSLERGTRRRAAWGYVIYALAIGVSGWSVASAWQVFMTKPLMMASLVWNALFMIYVIYRLNRHVAAQASTADAGVLDTLRFHRRQLERQRDYRRGVWRWVALGLLPGFLLQAVSLIRDSLPWWEIALLAGVLALAVAFDYAVGRYRSGLSQREIDALDSLAG